MAGQAITRLGRRFRSYAQKKASRLMARRMRTWRSDVPHVSFTFDDFPRSAGTAGREILEKYDVRGTYYTSLGLMGADSQPFRMFELEDLEELIRTGHEIGCHSFGHLDPWKTAPGDFEESLKKNGARLESLFPGYAFRTFSYPLRQPHPGIKRIAGEMFWCCRGGGQMPNAGRVDLNCLRSCFIDQRQRDNLEYFVELIGRNVRQKGWLIFSTHDIAPDPSPFGCSPRVFEEIVRRAVDSGSSVLPVREVYAKAFSR
jgi:hypothetical protein